MAMQDKIGLITGATNGIGKAAALALARQGMTLVIVGRSPAKTQAVRDEIRAASDNGRVEMIVADLSAMAEVRRAAGEFLARFDRLDVLMNNAGAVFSERRETVDGYEMTFALNHLSYFLLTNLLLERLKASAPAHIINVSSGAHRGATINFDDLHLRRGYGLGGFKAYSQSKLANILFTYELARRLAGSGVTANAMHPGFVATGFGRNNPGLMNAVMGLLHRFALTPEQGADTLVYLATAPEVEGVTGQYFEKRKPVRSSAVSYDESVARRLWEVSESLVGLAQPTPAA